MRLGIVGTGAMASAMALTAARSGNVETVAIVSSDLDRARRFAARHVPAARGFDRLVAASGDVDAFYVATTPDRHLEAITASLDAGKPVLCEKPLTPSLEQTERVIAHARDAKRALVESIWPLALPSYASLFRRVDGLGDDVPRRLTFDFSYPLGPGAGAHFLDPETGGVLLDRGVYGYAAAIRLLGPVRRQSCRVYRDATGLDRSAVLVLEHELARTVSVLTLSFDHLGPNRLELSTGRGLAVLGAPSLAAEASAWIPHLGAGGTAASGRLGGWLRSRQFLRRIKFRRDSSRWWFLPYGSTPYAPMLQEFVSVVADGAQESGLVPLGLSRDIAAQVSEARASQASSEGGR